MIKVDKKEFTFTLEDYAVVAAGMFDLLNEPMPDACTTEEYKEIDKLIRIYVVMSDTIVNKANFPEKTVFVNTMN